jgi:hypothetical protein
MTLTEASRGHTTRSNSTYRVYGPAAPGSDQALQVVVLAVHGYAGGAPETSDSLTVRGTEGWRWQGAGLQCVAWEEQSHTLTLCAGDAFNPDALLQIAEGIVTGPAPAPNPAQQDQPATITAEPTWLPPDFELLWDGFDIPPQSTIAGSSYAYFDADSREQFLVTTWSEVPDAASWEIEFPAGATEASVRGSRAWLIDRSADDNPVVLWWVEEPGVVVRVQHNGGDAAETLAFAEGLVPLDTEAWTAFAAGVVPQVASDQATTTQPPRTGIDGTLRYVGGLMPDPRPATGEVVVRHGTEVIAEVTVTAEHGRFQLDVPPGTYEVTATMPQACTAVATVSIDNEQMAPVELDCHVR